MANSPSFNSNFIDLLKDPNSSLEDIVSSKDFFKYWSKSEPLLFSYIIKHYNDLIEIGFQTKAESINSIRCLQIMSSKDFKFHHLLITKTNLLKFVHDYLFNINDYPSFSQKNYFYVLPNIMLDKLGNLLSIFDEKYFKELFSLIKNDYAFAFTMRITRSAPNSMSKMLERIDLNKIVVSNLFTYSQTDKWNQEIQHLYIKSQILFKGVAFSKFGGDLINELLNRIDDLIEKTIEHPCTGSLEFIGFIDEFAMKKKEKSKWRKIHSKIVPYLDSFCAVATTACGNGFTLLAEKCTQLAIRIVFTTRNATDSFIALFMYLISLFFKEQTNTFLHNCTIDALELLISLGQINSQFLDKNELFEKVTNCYEKEEKGIFLPFAGQLRIIAKAMEPFAAKSKTVDFDKWKKYVVEKNKDIEHKEKENYGGHVPSNIINKIRRPLRRLFYHSPSFKSKNLSMEEKHFKKLAIKNPLA